MRDFMMILLMVCFCFGTIYYIGYVKKDKEVPQKDYTYLLDSIESLKVKMKTLDSVNILLYRSTVKFNSQIKTINHEIEIVKNNLPTISDSSLDSIILSVQ